MALIGAFLIGVSVAGMAWMHVEDARRTAELRRDTNRYLSAVVNRADRSAASDAGAEDQP